MSPGVVTRKPWNFCPAFCGGCARLLARPATAPPPSHNCKFGKKNFVEDAASYVSLALKPRIESDRPRYQDVFPGPQSRR